MSTLKVLLTTTSFQDTPGPHHEILNAQNWEIVRERGPLPESRMLELAGQFDAFLCGDDAISARVIDANLPRLKVISKYGIGLDKIDLKKAQEVGLPVLFTPGVNHTTVAEHTIALLLALVRNLVPSINATREGKWTRLTGHELWQKKIGLVGLGRIGIETAKRAKAFDMELHAFGNYWPDEASELQMIRHETLESLAESVDILSLHTKLTAQTRHLIEEKLIQKMKPGSILVNTSRGELVDSDAVLDALNSGHLSGYATDVMEVEPPPSDHPLLSHPKAIVTAHIGSRTYESVPRQALKSVTNLVNFLKGEGEVSRAI